MKKLLTSICLSILVFLVVPYALAGMCTTENPGSANVTLTVSPTDTCPGDVLYISGMITNTGDCVDFYLVRFQFKYFYEYQSDWLGHFPGSSWLAPLTPKFLVPIVPGESFDFNYSAPLPEMIPMAGYTIPPGTYSLTIEAKGTRGGAVSQDTVEFSVCSYVRGELLVGFNDYVTREEAEDIIISCGAELKTYFDSIGAASVLVPEGEEMDYIDIFMANPDVKYAEPNYYTYPYF